MEPLQNEFLRLEFDQRGLTALRDLATARTIALAEDGFSVSVATEAIESGALTPVVETGPNYRRSYRFDSTGWTVRAIYELKPGWRFWSKNAPNNVSTWY